MFYPHPKYKLREDYTVKICSNYLENPCKKFEDVVFKKGDVFEASASSNPDTSIIHGFAKMSPFSIPLSKLEKVADETPVTDLFPTLSTEKINAERKTAQELEENRIKKMFIIPTAVILVVVWIYGIRKL